jgi:uncharacterized protein YfeS
MGLAAFLVLASAEEPRGSGAMVALAHDEDWELGPENGHPVARRLLRDAFFWSLADDGAPLGSDTGADTLAFYRRWRGDNPAAPIAEFVDKTLESWGVGRSPLDGLDDRELRSALDEDHFSILTHDDFIIALAFSQLVLEGRVDPDVKAKALRSIHRQTTDVVIAFRGWVSPKERKSRLAKMKSVLEAVG